MWSTEPYQHSLGRPLFWMDGHSTDASLEGVVSTEGQLRLEHTAIAIVLLEFKYGTEDGHNYNVEQSGATVL